MLSPLHPQASGQLPPPTGAPKGPLRFGPCSRGRSHPGVAEGLDPLLFCLSSPRQPRGVMSPPKTAPCCPGLASPASLASAVMFNLSLHWGPCIFR